MIKIAVHGAAGRVGCRLIDLVGKDQGLELVAAMEQPNHSKLGSDSGTVAGTEPNGILLSSQLDSKADVMIDFSLPEAVNGMLNLCETEKIPLVLATTGFDKDVEQNIHHVAKTVPIVWAPNMSLAVNLVMKLTETAAKALTQVESGVDVEIIETHHRFKADSPSGTALKFGEIVQNQMGQDSAAHGREGQVGGRPVSEIGYHAVRAGDDAGQHTILFGMMGEKIELKVAASNRDCYATGAMTAARFVTTAEPGLYSMYDVLGL